MAWDLSGKVAFVTGAGSGIGRAVALNLAREGVAVAVADIRKANAEAVAAEIEEGGGKVLTLELDVSDSSQVNAAVAKTRAELGPIDYLANIAGIGGNALVHEISDEDWIRMISVHLNGTFFCTRAILPEMLERGSGGIACISSLHAQKGQPGAAHYSAAKAGIIGFIRAVAREVADKGIRINGIAPGPIDTPLWRGDMKGDELERHIENRTRPELVPLNRLGQPQDIADTMMWLFSGKSSYVTGQIIPVNGGELMV
ncbi:MAG: 3-oxoacyl-[acyl-carrier protein] reductase [Chloroflexi bacterium]|jgi:3-oxoacyl-[acyl-carrier protein] reductase|nr:MAG: 3-oxoacyl-[acyl-carrier protein] reductase [Chloroflexota bacterium]